MDKKISIEEIKKKYHPKIYTELRPILESIETMIDLKIVQNPDDVSRLHNLKVQFIRSLIFSESEKYVSEKKPTVEGFAHDYYAVTYCFEKLLFNKYKKLKKTISEVSIRDEAKRYTYIGIHKKIDKAARYGYKKNNAEIMEQLAILIADKNLSFDSPFLRFIKKHFLIIVLVFVTLMVYLMSF